MGKSDANECNESSLSNCRVQLTLSTKKNGMILEERYSNEEPNIKFFKILIGVTICNIVVKHIPAGCIKKKLPICFQMRSIF